MWLDGIDLEEGTNSWHLVDLSSLECHAYPLGAQHGSKFPALGSGKGQRRVDLCFLSRK